MRTLSNNIRVPEDDDAGNVWADAIEHDLEILNDLKGDVENITVADIKKEVTLLDKANWEVDPDGKGYKQTVSMPTGYTLTNSKPSFYIASGTRIYTPVYPTVKPLGLTSFDVFINDSTLDVGILYV